MPGGLLLWCRGSVPHVTALCIHRRVLLPTGASIGVAAGWQLAILAGVGVGFILYNSVVPLLSLCGRPSPHPHWRTWGGTPPLALTRLHPCNRDSPCALRGTTVYKGSAALVRLVPTATCRAFGSRPAQGPATRGKDVPRSLSALAPPPVPFLPSCVCACTCARPFGPSRTGRTMLIVCTPVLLPPLLFPGTRVHSSSGTIAWAVL